jgi:hypothetical protein
MDPAWAQMAQAMQELRPWILQRMAAEPAQRREALRALAGDEAIQVLSSRGIDGLRAWIGQRFPLLASQ